MKVTHRLTRVSACSQRTTSMSLILLEVSWIITHRLVRVSACSQRALSSIFHSWVDKSLDMQPKGYLHATCPAGSVSETY